MKNKNTHVVLDCYVNNMSTVETAYVDITEPIIKIAKDLSNDPRYKKVVILLNNVAKVIFTNGKANKA